MPKEHPFQKKLLYRKQFFKYPVPHTPALPPKGAGAYAMHLYYRDGNMRANL